MTEQTVAQSVEALLQAWRNPAARLASLPAAPHNEAEVHAIHQGLMAELGPIGGWKVGASGEIGAITYAPLPTRTILPNGAVLRGMQQRWVEAEIAVTFGQDLPPGVYSHAEIVEAIATIQPVIEVVNSRFIDSTAQDPLSQQADLGIHGALIVGEPGHWPDLENETVQLSIDGGVVAEITGHPAGDMIRLLRHLVGTEGIKKGQIVTTGSWNPITQAPANSTAVAAFASLKPVTVRFEE